jgi:hypothetical protein
MKKAKKSAIKFMTARLNVYSYREETFNANARKNQGSKKHTLNTNGKVPVHDRKATRIQVLIRIVVQYHQISKIELDQN